MSVAAALAVAGIGIFSFSFAFKLGLFAAVLVICPALYISYKTFSRNRAGDGGQALIKMPASEIAPAAAEHIFPGEVAEKLLALEEIGEFFGTSLKPADMFRLLGNRIAEMIPFDGCFLFLTNESGDVLRISHAAGEDPVRFNGLLFDPRKCLAGKAMSENRPLSDTALSFDDKLFPQHFKMSIAAPVNYQGKKLGALAISSAAENTYDENSLLMLGAVAEKISSLINNSFNNQRNSASALTDMITSLPNEAAFYLILEQQIAEAERFAEKRALTVLCMDIKDFNKINLEHGHSAGDQLLTFTARIIKNQLRQMDFLAHPRADEFWAILPGASSSIVELVIERLDRAFSKSLFSLPAESKIDIELHFGTATFKKDGDSAAELVESALKQKSEEKYQADNPSNSVIPFPLRNGQITEHSF